MKSIWASTSSANSYINLIFLRTRSLTSPSHFLSFPGYFLHIIAIAEVPEPIPSHVASKSPPALHIKAKSEVGNASLGDDVPERSRHTGSEICRSSQHCRQGRRRI